MGVNLEPQELDEYLQNSPRPVRKFESALLSGIYYVM